jgi:putative membrane protein
MHRETGARACTDRMCSRVLAANPYFPGTTNSCTMDTVNNSEWITRAMMNSVIFAFMGIVILVISFFLIELLTPKHNIRREILENKNMAVAVLAGSFMLAVAIIIAAAIS